MRYFRFLKRQFQLGHVIGIPVRADYRWILVIVLLTWITALNVSQFVGNAVASTAFGLATTFIFFGSILVHELAHAVVARIEGLRVKEIVLHPFGGLTRFSREPRTAQSEFRIAIAGPAASFILAILFLGLLSAANFLGDQNVLAPLFFLLFLLNFLVAIFNMFPGYPLDGGRVLRSFLWKRGTDLDEATILTGRFGQIIAVVMILFGVVIAVARGDIFTGFWTLLVGIFLFDSARSIIRQVSNRQKRTVQDAMTLPVPLEPGMTVQEFVDSILPLHRRTVFPVAKARTLHGLLLLEDLKELPREKWRETSVDDVMRPVHEDHFIESDALYADAAILMNENGIGALCVLDDAGRLVGFIPRRL